MGFSPKAWKDYPDTSTPITAAALQDLETRVTGYTDSVAVVTTDPRLSDQRTPLDGSVTDAKVASGAAVAYSKLALTGSVVNADISATAAIAESKLSLATDAAAGTGSRRTLGTGAQQAAAGNDSRLSDSRTPLAHASTHLPGGSDAIAFGASILMSGTEASLPAAAAANAGCFYFATDTFILRRSTGSAWVIVMMDSERRYALSSTTVREPYPRYAGGAGNLSITGGQMQMTGIQLFAGDVVTNISFQSGSTALTQGTNNDGHWWFALYSSSATPSLLAQTADQTTAAWAGGAIKTLALTSPQTISTTGWYYACMMVNPGTGGSPATPTIRGVNLGNANISGGSASGWPAGLKLGSTNGASLGATAPAGPITPAAGANYLYCQLS